MLVIFDQIHGSKFFMVPSFWQKVDDVIVMLSMIVLSSNLFIIHFDTNFHPTKFCEDRMSSSLSKNKSIFAQWGVGYHSPLPLASSLYLILEPRWLMVAGI